LRLHTDNSVEVRYYNKPGSFINRAAFSLTQDVGEETGGGVNGFTSDPVLGPAQFFISGMAYNRFWMSNDHLGLTLGAGYIHNPGRYLVLAPTGQASPFYNQYNPTAPVSSNAFAIDAPGTQFTGWDGTVSIDWMPNELETWMLQFVYREANVPYFAGPGGVTSPDGYTNTSTSGWVPDLVQSEARIIAAFLVRF
jgi:hypothetical protein